MARGGYRVGAGRPRKAKVQSPKPEKSSELTPEQRENVKLLLSFGERLKDGGTLTRTELKQLDAMEWGLTADEERVLKEFQESLRGVK